MTFPLKCITVSCAIKCISATPAIFVTCMISLCEGTEFNNNFDKNGCHDYYVRPFQRTLTVFVYTSER